MRRLRHPDRGPHCAEQHRGAGRRHQRDGMPRGRHDSFSGQRLDGALAARRVRERGGGRVRRRDRSPGTCPPRRAGGRAGDVRRLRRRRRNLRHRAPSPVRRARAWPPHDLRLLRQPGLHEHGRPAIRSHTALRVDDDHAGGPREHGQAAGAQGHRGDRGCPPCPLRRSGRRLPLAGSLREGPQCGRCRLVVHQRPRRLPARLAPHTTDRRPRLATRRGDARLAALRRRRRPLPADL